MRIERSTELALYAVLAMDEKLVYRVEDLANKIGTTYAFLSQIMVKLRDHGLLSAVRGPNGGYVKYSEPTVKQVIEAIRGNKKPNQLEELLLGKFEYPVSDLGDIHVNNI